MLEKRCEANSKLSGVAEHTGDESREHPVNPASDYDHGQHVGDVALEHVGHHAGVCHHVLGDGRTFLRQVPRFFIVEELAAHQKR